MRLLLQNDSDRFGNQILRFLDDITQGRLPTELRALGTEVNVSMEDRRNDTYEENKPKEQFKSFVGSGNRLGASSEPSTSSSTSSAPISTPTIDVDKSKPVTKLRIRLGTGKQIVQGNYLVTQR